MTREEAMKGLSYIADEMSSIECGDWKEAIYMAIKALEQEPKWIPVTERLPEKQDEYLVTWTAEAFRDEPFIQIIEFDIEDRAWILERYMKEMYRDVTITAWMPLPQPYKAESEAEDGNNN